MQIHEIFRRRADEGVLKGIPVARQAVSNFAQRAGQVGKAVAYNLAGQVLQKAGLPKDLGDGSKEAGFGSGMDAAAKVNEPLIRQIATRLQERYDLGVKQAMQKERVATPMQLSSVARTNIVTSLKNYLHSKVMQNKVGVDYKQLPRYIDPQHRDQANRTVAAMDNVISKIASFSANGVTPDDWRGLANSAYNAMSLMQFYPSQDTREKELGLSNRIDKLLQFYSKAIKDPSTPQDTLDAVKQALYKHQGAQAMSPQQLQKLASIEQRSAAYDRGQPLTFGGVKMDPTDPKDAAVLAALRQQGKI